MKMIPKDALVAEIERRIKILQKNPFENHKTICHLDSLKQSYNTLEVKEVDLKDEVERFAKECGYNSAATIDFQFAKHFFLNLK